nr:methyltransferase [uncultured Dongia sp.]
MTDDLSFPVSSDQLLGGRLTLLQPKEGYRAAIDPVLLAAAVPAAAGDLVLDLGCGVGTAGLCLAVRVPGARVFGLDLQGELITLATHNAAANSVGDRVTFRCGDVLDFRDDGFDHVLVNPPYLARDKASISPNPIKAAANVEGDARLTDWVAAAIAAVKTGGSVTFIHRADRAEELLTLMANGLGALTTLTLLPRDDVAAKRVIVQGVKGSASTVHGQKTWVLHQADGRFTSQTEAVLRDAAALPLKALPLTEPR